MSLLIALTLAAAQGGDLHFISEGMTQKTGGYSPLRAEMKSELGVLLKVPAGLKSGQTGLFQFGTSSFAFILDEPEGGTPRFYLDANANFDLTDDPAITWTGTKQGEFMLYQGSGKINLHGKMAGVNFYRFDPKDPNREKLKNMVLYYSDFGYEGHLTFGGKTYPIQFSGDVGPASYIWVDRNGNGKRDGRSESISAAKPFNFDGVTYELKVENGSFSVAKSDKSVPEYKLPPNLAVGQTVPAFEALATDGTKISFPKSYAGKIVMIDFWATWCGPCMAEMPNVVKAYQKYHDQGFEILGISFDQANAEQKLKDTTAKSSMPWRQIYEGKYWNTALGLQFGVEAIPFGLIIDGSTGKILANSPRGDALEKVLEAAFASRKSGG